MKEVVLKEVFKSIVLFIRDGSRIVFDDVWIDEDEESISIQCGDEEFKVIVNKK